MMLHIIVQIAMYLLENIEVGVVKPIIELTTCFHEFAEYESPNLFHQYLSVEKQTKILIVPKKTFFLSFEYLKKSKQIPHNIWWKNS